jgi:AmmeMemoRadiSam system protein B
MDIRPSPIAGLWYPGEPAELAAAVDGYLRAAPPQPDIRAGQVVGLLVPHAGHVYSGPVAGHAFRVLDGAAFDVVALVCPSHRHPDGPVITTGHAAYATPLGLVPVADDLLAQLRDDLGGRLVAIRHDQEHAIEIELPFLQRVLAPGFRLLPLMLRDQGEDTARALGQALARALRGQRALLVASSDLSHYFHQAEAQALDAELLRQVAAFNPAGVLAAHESGRGQACGVGAIAAVLWAARELGAAHVRVVNAATSGDVSGDYDQVVGYGAAVIWREPEAAAA